MVVSTLGILAGVPAYVADVRASGEGRRESLEYIH